MMDKLEWLIMHGYTLCARDEAVRPGFTGRFMVVDLNDNDGFAVVGNDLAGLIEDAYTHLRVTPA